MILTERDEAIIREIARWRGVLGHHVKAIGGFTGTRATDRRLKKLVDEKLLTRKKYVYGLAGIYQVTRKAQKLLGLDTYLGTIRLDQAVHDMAVVDTYLYFRHKYNLAETDVISEKELRHEQGFITRGHAPDLLFKQKGELHCVEVELSQKAKGRLEKNVADNYIKYATQIWIIPKNNKRVKLWIEEFATRYPNIEIIDKGVIDEFRNDN